MFKCGNCKTQRDIGDDVYLVESAFCDFIPTCSKECAEFIKQREIKKLENKLNRIKNTEIKKERW